MKTLKNFSGFLAIFVVSIGIIISSRVAGDLYVEEDFVFSNFGADDRSAFIFNLTIVVSGLLLFVFSYALSNSDRRRKRFPAKLFFHSPSMLFILIAFSWQFLQHPLSSISSYVP